MNVDQLIRLLAHHHNTRLAEYPTPLEYMQRLSGQAGRPIFIKRDDSIGPKPGGNKTRKLEYLLAQAQDMRAKKIVTFGALQSNHARLTAACAIQNGFEPHILYFEKRPDRFEGNLELIHRMGAKMHFIPLGKPRRITLEQANRFAWIMARLVVGRNYFIPAGGHTWLGCLGYVQAACELEQQAKDLGISNAWLITAAGTGGTLAGLLAGFTLLESKMKPLGIDIGRLWKNFPRSIARLAAEICEHLNASHPFQPSEIPLIQGSYAGEGYGIPSAEGAAAIHQLIRTENIFLDPVYTGKAFAALLDLVASGKFPKDEPVVFLHTGGLPENENKRNQPTAYPLLTKEWEGSS